MRLHAKRFSKALPALVLVGLCLAASAADAKSDTLWTERKSGRPLVDVSGLAGAAFTRVIHAIEPAVVFVSTEQNLRPGPSRRRGGPRDPFWEFFDRFFQAPNDRSFRRHGLGSGFVINASGLILTNYHVVENADQIKVHLPDGSDYDAEAVGWDERTDIAVLRIKPSKPLPVAPLGDSSKLEKGEWVVAIGNPFGLEGSATKGIVSALGRKDVQPGGRQIYADFIQTDALINPGNSGGPLVNMFGEVIGINTAINAAGQGIGFAIPINMAKRLLPQLVEQGKVTRSWIGIKIQPVTRELAQSFGLAKPEGALVAEVVPGGPAAAAGIREEDIILDFDGKTIDESSELPWLASVAGIGRTVPATIWRGGKKRSFKITLTEMPQGPIAGPLAPDALTSELGLSVARLVAATRKELGLPGKVGVLVAEVEPGGPAARAGVSAGDVVLRVGSTPVHNPSEFLEAVRKVEQRGVVRLLLFREGEKIFVALRKP